MARKVKFSSKLDAELLSELRNYAKETKRPIADLLSEAVAQYLHTVRVRPIFRNAVEEVIQTHADLLKRLAR